MTRLLCVIVLVACSGGPSAKAQATGPQASGLGPQPGDGPQASQGHPGPEGARDCDKLIAHAIDVGTAERPADQKPTADERAKIETQMRPTWRSKCEQMTSKGYDCAIAAQSLAQLDACGG